MIFAHTAVDADQGPLSIAAEERPPYVVNVPNKEGTPPELMTRALLRIRTLPLDSAGRSINLWEDPILLLDVLNQEFEVEGWGLRMKVSDAQKVPREMSRQFLRLWSKSERRSLSDEEFKYWQQIISQVDYQKFCADRAPYRYVEGELLKKEESEAIIRWADTQTESVRGNNIRALELVDEGETFSAYVKFNRRSRLQSIEQVTPLGPTAALLQEMDLNWIETN